MNTKVYVLTYFDEGAIDSTKVSESKETLIEEVKKQCLNWNYDEEDIQPIVESLANNNSYEDTETEDMWTLVESEMI